MGRTILIVLTAFVLSPPSMASNRKKKSPKSPARTTNQAESMPAKPTAPEAAACTGNTGVGTDGKCVPPLSPTPK